MRMVSTSHRSTPRMLPWKGTQHQFVAPQNTRDGYIPVAGDEDDTLQHPSIRRDIPHGGILHVHPEDGNYTYAYGPAGIAGLLHNYYALGCAVFASIGGLTFGYDQGVIANVLVMKDFVTRWHLSAWDTGLMSTSFPCF